MRFTQATTVQARCTRYTIFPCKLMMSSCNLLSTTIYALEALKALSQGHSGLATMGDPDHR